MDTAPATKLRAIERLGATIVKAPYDECWRTVEHHRSDRMQGHFVHPFDDDHFISGNGTIGLEIVEDLPDVDAVIAPLGGGGLLAGIAIAPAGAAARASRSTPRSRRRPRRWRVVRRRPRAAEFDGWTPSFVDGAGGRSVLDDDVAAAARLRSTESLVVSLDEVAARDGARGRARARHRRRRGGCAVAAALSPRFAARGHRKVVAVVSGGNIDLARFAALVGRVRVTTAIGRMTLWTRTSIPHRPGDPRTYSSGCPELANDLWWTWNARAREVFRKLDYPLWRQTAHNPVLMLRLISPEMLDARGAGRALPRALRRGDRALDARAQRQRHVVAARASPTAPGPIAYFSAEFALHQSLPIYAGGLGVLAGDHCKEASDLGIPLIGVGFMYPQGYFHQIVSPEGWQQEIYERLNWADAPVEPAITPDGKPCVIAVPLGNRSVLVVGVARAARPREALPARHRSRRERAVGSRAVGAPLRRRSRDAHPAGDHPRHRRRPRAEGARHASRRPGTSTKATPRSSCCSASAI